MLKNTRIVTKIAIIVVALSVVGLAGLGRLTGMMADIDGQYRDLLARSSAASFEIARANAELGRLQREGRAEGRPSAEVVAAMRDTIRRALRVLPAESPALSAVDARLGGAAAGPGTAPRSPGELDALVEATERDLATALQATAGRTEDEASALASSVQGASRLALTIGYLAIAGAIGLAMIISARSITGPLARLRTRMIELADGQLDGAVEGRDRQDEIGGMARAVEVFKANALRTRALEAAAETGRRTASDERARSDEVRRSRAGEQAAVVTALDGALANISTGDLTDRLVQPFAPDYEGLRANFNAALDGLRRTLGQVAQGTNGIRAGSDEISRAADDLSRRTEQQANTLRETATALDQITATVRRTSDGTILARNVVSRAKADAENSSGIVERAVSAMGEIAQSSAQIGEIIGFIDELALQTSLLALNAGIEAARAGDAGKGFAVIAAEVRALAQRSAEAANEIKSLISTASGRVAAGVELVGETGDALARIVSHVGEINAIVQDIAGSANEQATGLNQVNAAISSIDEFTQLNVAMVEKSTRASHSLADGAGELADIVGRFRIGVPTVATQAPQAARDQGRAMRA